MRILSKGNLQNRLVPLLRSQNRSGYPQTLEEVLEEILTRYRISPPTNCSVSMHYFSPFVGKWFRCIPRTSKKSLKERVGSAQYSEFELSTYQDLYQELPKEFNFMMSDAVTDEVHVVFGDNPIATQGKRTICVTGKEWSILKGLLLSQHLVDFLKYGHSPDPKKSFGKEFKMLKLLADRIKKVVKNREQVSEPQIINMFLCSFYYAIRSQEPDKWVLVSIYPSVVGPQGTKVGSLCIGAFGKNEKPLNLEYAFTGNACSYKASEFAVQLFQELLELEYSVGSEQRTLIALEENVVRECCYVRQETLLKVNKTQKWVEQQIKTRFGEPHSKIAKDLDFFTKFTFASLRFEQFLNDLAAQVSEREPAKEGEVHCFFLFGEPGTGKETLAKLIHILSRRAWIKPPRRKDIEEKYWPAIGKHYSQKIWVRGEKQPFSLASMLKRRHKPPSTGAFLGLNYFTVLGSLLNDQEFDCVLFGDLSDNVNKIGCLTLASLLRGTVFLDEFHTIPSKDLVNRFLRLLSDQCEISIPGFEKREKANITLVASSNKTPDQLMSEMWNEAVLDRMTEHYFTVPPLRERKEDIAVLVNYFLNKHNSDITKGEVRIAKIELQGMRLLCELPWLKNYRGLKGLLQLILDTRRSRKIASEVVTFDEVLQAVVAREVFQHSGKAVRQA